MREIIGLFYSFSKLCHIKGWTKSISTSRRRHEDLQIDGQEQGDNFQIERQIANEIMENVNRLELPLKLDQLTEGKGNCFPMSILQQCHRPEIKQQLKPIPKMLLKLGSGGHSALRYNVRRFIINSDHPRIQEFRRQYEELDGTVNMVPWKKYWASMMKDGAWVDYWFVQATAWYLEIDIWIIATSSREDSPYIVISGNLDDGDKPCNGPIITLGTKSNCHYQSLLPIEMFHLEFRNKQQHPEEARQMFNKVLDPNTEVARPLNESNNVNG